MIKIILDELTNRKEIFSVVEQKVDVSSIVKDIIENVKQRGDKALFEYTEKFDKAKLTDLKVTEQEIQDAVNSVDPEFIKILKKAAENIKGFHQQQKREGFEIKKDNGVIVGQKIIPVDVAGIYVPGGTAAYPSTVLMDAIPAIVAGCKRVVMVTPPNKDGKINPVAVTAEGVEARPIK